MRQAILDSARRARAAHEESMLDTVLIVRPGAMVLDTDTGVLTPEVETIYEGRAGHLYLETVVRPYTRTDATVTDMWYVLKVPIYTPVLKINDVVTFIQTSDPNIINGVPFRVANFVSSKWQVVRRVMIEQVNDRA